MHHGRHGWSYILLRAGLGIVFLWIGIDMVRHPDTWIGYLPGTLPFGFSRSLFLTGNAILDSIIGIFLLLNFFPRIVAAIAVLHLLGILIVHPIDAVLIRDVGLLGTALALLTWPQHYKRHR